MGKYLTSLLALVILLVPQASFASEQIHRVQEELRKRLLFFNDLNGEYTPALATAIKRYQEKKGFASTGVIDLEVLASLGIAGPAPVTGRVIGFEDEGAVMYGPYGEALPRSAPANAGGLGSVAVAETNIDSAIPQERWPQEPAPPGEAAVETAGVGEDCTPFPVAFELTNERIHRHTQSGTRTALVLPPPAGTEWTISIEENRAEKAGKLKSRARKPTRRVRHPKERNPIILAFQSVDRLMRNLFDGTPERKKRATPKRS